MARHVVSRLSVRAHRLFSGGKLPLAATLALLLVASPAFAAPLGTPALAVGQNILQETGEITVPGFPATTVVRYTWRDSQGDPRSVALVPASPATSGFALQMTYVVSDVGVKRTAVVNADPAGDGGFGYFVSHELFRDFDDGQNTVIAAYHGEDDSPLGRYLPSTGSAQSVSQSQATHEFRLDYPRWGTVAPVAGDPSAVVISANPANHQKYMLPVVIRWHFVAGQDYPLWSVDYDLTGTTDHIATDVRGPYGAFFFNEGNGPDVTALKWGDKYKFSADAGAGDFGAAALPPNNLAWTWNTLNAGRRYNVLASGSYEFGLVDTVPFSASKYADGYADPAHRNGTSAGGGCATGLRSLPCDFEWAYQSFQYDYGPPARAKLAWGSAPFLGTSLTAAYNGLENLPLSGTGHIRYGLHVVYGRAGAGTPLTNARAAAPLEAAPTLSVSASPGNGGTVSYTVLGDTGGPYTSASKLLAPWDSVRLVATPAGGFTFGGWTGACAGAAGNTCIIAVGQSLSVGATFNGGGTPGAITPSPASVDFGGQSLMTTAPAIAVTFTNTGGAPVSIASIGVSTYFAVTHNCGALNAGASCTANVTFTPTAQGALAGTLTVTSDAAGSPNSVPLAGTGERSLVTHYYRSILRRAPDGGGKAFWEGEAARMQSIGVNVNETWYAMAQSFYTSAEYLAFGRDDAGFVTDLYNTFFNRAPDGAGLSFWTGQIASGMPREVVLVGFMFSTEFVNFTQAIFGNTAVRKEIDTVVDFYRGILGRLPDNGGFAFWVQQFRTAQCQGASAVNAQVESISSQFALSGEYAARARGNAQYVGDLYNSFLRRGGDLGGVQFWISQVATAAQTREQERRAFVASPEFQARVAAVIAQGCLP